MTRTRRFLILPWLIASIQASSSLTSAQAINVLRTTPSNDEAKLVEAPSAEYAFPVGASGGFGGAGEAAGGGVLGFQMWKKGAFASLSVSPIGTRDVSGTQGDFGTYLLNPGSNAKSFAVALAKSWWGVNASLMKGFFLRAGGSWATWKPDGNPSDGVSSSSDGAVLYASGGFQLVSMEYPVTTDNGDNIYQFGVELGPAVRLLTGNLLQDDAFRQGILNTDKGAFWGAELTLFARLNEVKPYVRISTFSAGTDIRGFTGLQAYLGIDVLGAVFHNEFKSN